ncbi:uncharacterized protein LOC117636680 [Prunus dulcis]|uniref:uncharacterized protein LOC117636680 n=1 Tax=Prunus dulcis TaxID=3755 RepID=UPI0014828E8D|nr:uncharacterized protein LOC117636680 [Prunus dulcis]
MSSPLFASLTQSPPNQTPLTKLLRDWEFMASFSESHTRKPTSPLLVFPFALLLFILSSSAYSDDTLSAYEMLQQYDFPIGLLPKGVTGYELDRDTGNFKAYFNGTCSFSLENSYQLRYRSTITGVLSKDRLKNLKGVSVKVLFFWIDIVEVVRNGDELQFSVGIASADFSIDNFEESPQCGCGFACQQLVSSAVPSHSVRALMKSN